MSSLDKYGEYGYPKYNADGYPKYSDDGYAIGIPAAKSCPFCGGPVSDGYGNNPDGTYSLRIMCKKCKVYMKGKDNEYELVTRWNRRVG